MKTMTNKQLANLTILLNASVSLIVVGFTAAERAWFRSSVKESR